MLLFVFDLKLTAFNQFYSRIKTKQKRSIVSSPHLQVFENGSLNILDARDSDVGHYMCQATNGVGPGLSKVIKVTVNGKCSFVVETGEF